MPFGLDRTYMQLALGGGLVVGLCAPLLGAFLVQRRMALIGDGIGHVAFAGVAAGLLTGVWPVWTALVAAVSAAAGIEHLRRNKRASGDVALSLFFYSGIAAGVVMIGLAGSLNASLFSYLFGSILTIEPQELLFIVAVGVVVVGVIALSYKAMFAVVVDEEWASVAGIPSRALGMTLTVLSAAIIVTAMKIVGLLLVAALMVLPVASAQLVARSFRTLLFWSSAIGAMSVVVGLAAARTWALAPGATIVLACAATFAVLSLTVGRKRRPTVTTRAHTH